MKSRRRRKRRKRPLSELSYAELRRRMFKLERMHYTQEKKLPKARSSFQREPIKTRMWEINEEYKKVIAEMKKRRNEK